MVGHLAAAQFIIMGVVYHTSRVPARRDRFCVGSLLISYRLSYTFDSRPVSRCIVTLFYF